MAYLMFVSNTVHSEIEYGCCSISGVPSVRQEGSIISVISSFVSVSSIVHLACFVAYVFLVNRGNVTVVKFSKGYSTGLNGLLFALGSQQNMVAVYSQLRDNSRSIRRS